MGLLDLFRAGETHYECRRCGRTLGSDRGHCPGCGGDVASYEV